MTLTLREMVAERFDLIPERNVLKFFHGDAFETPIVEGYGGQGRFQKSQVPFTVARTALVDNDFSELLRHLEIVAEAFASQQGKRFYEVAAESAESVGNVVDASSGIPIAEAYLALLEKPEYGVDENGQVTRPSLHMHPDVMARIRPVLEAQGPEFHATIDEIVKRKSAEALARELARKSKFRTR